MPQPESTHICEDCHQPIGVTAARSIAVTDSGAPARCPSCRVARLDSRKRQLASFWRTN